MSAECYWCVTTHAPRTYAPLGTCSDCKVFACDKHAERNKALGKWKCFDAVAKAVAAGARLEAPEDLDEDPITDPAQLAARYPRIFAATEAERQHWSTRGDELMAAAQRAAPDREQHMLENEQRSKLLLAHAVGIVEHYLPTRIGITAIDMPRPSGRLGLLMRVL